MAAASCRRRTGVLAGRSLAKAFCWFSSRALCLMRLEIVALFSVKKFVYTDKCIASCDEFVEQIAKLHIHFVFASRPQM